MSDPSQAYTPPLLPPGTVLGGRYRLVEPLVGVDDKVIAGGWLGVDQQLGERRVVVRVAPSADPAWISSREAFGNVAAPLLDCLPLEGGAALIWRLPNQAVRWESSTLSREQRAAMIVGVYRAICLDTTATSWVSDTALFALPSALGSRPWIAPAERHGHTADGAKAENLNALAKVMLALLFGVVDSSDADALARLPARIVEVVEPWLSDDGQERLANPITPLELATALGVTEASDRVPVPTATVSKSASTKNRVAAARALAKRVTQRERIAFVVLLVLLALGYLGLFAFSPSGGGTYVEADEVNERPAIEVATAQDAVEVSEPSARLTMPALELTAVTPNAFLRPSGEAEVCREALDDGPVPSLLGCEGDLYPYEPRVHVFRDTEGRIELTESYDRADRPTLRRRYRYGVDGAVDRITTTSFTMVTQSVQHFDMALGLLTDDIAYADDASPDCLEWRFYLSRDGRYERFSCVGRADSRTAVDRVAPNYQATRRDGASTIIWDDDGRRSCSAEFDSDGEPLSDTCIAYEPTQTEVTHRLFQNGEPFFTSVETTTYSESGVPLQMRFRAEDGKLVGVGTSARPSGYDYDYPTDDRNMIRRTTVGMDGAPDAAGRNYDTEVIVEDALGNPVLVITEREGREVPTRADALYSRVLRTRDAGGRVTSLSYWDSDGLASTLNGVHHYEWDYENGRWPTEERRFDATGAPLAAPYDRVVWERDSSGSVETVRYTLDNALRSPEEIERNAEGRPIRRCARPNLVGSAIPGVPCVEYEWPSLDRVRMWFTLGPEFNSHRVLADVAGEQTAGVELRFFGDELQTMSLLQGNDRRAGSTSGVPLRCSEVQCIGLSGFWFDGEEPGALAR